MGTGNQFGVALPAVADEVVSDVIARLVICLLATVLLLDLAI